jgi:uncharacterized protein (TIGR01244 family)
MLIATGLALSAVATACGAEPWFGVPLPDPSGLDPAPLYQQRDFLAAGSIGAGASERFADIDGASLYEYVRDQVEFSLRDRDEGDLIWGRVAGGKGDRLVTAYVRDKFVEYGLSDVVVDTVPMPPQYWPVEAELALIGDAVFGDGSADYVFRTALPQPGSPPTVVAGISAELAYVGYGREVDIARAKLAGRIAVLRALPAQGGYNTARDVPDRLADAGAIGVIAVLDLPIDVQSYNRALSGTKVPTFAIADHEGSFVEQVLARAGETPVKARMRLKLDTDDSATSNVIGRVNGTSDEYVIVIAHHDAYFLGAVDNGSGVAAMLGLARHFATSPVPPRRTHLFVATGGHHAGGFPGSTKLATDSLGIRSRTAIVLNSEHVAAVQAIPYSAMDEATWGSTGGLLVSNAETPRFGSVVPQNAVVLDLFSGSLARNGVAMLANAWNAAPGDVMPFQQRGYPVAQIIEVSNWYHTTGDTLAAVPPAGLERATRAFAEFLRDIDERPIHEVGIRSEVTDLPKYNYPLPRIMTAGQPTVEGLQFAAADGYRTVIDLRGPKEDRGFDEGAAVRELGMSYVSLPIEGADGVSFENATALDRMLAEIDGPVLIHCTTGNRAGALLALRAGLHGADTGSAMTIGRNAGLTALRPIVEQRMKSFGE